jgi:hypothetical protein
MMNRELTNKLGIATLNNQRAHTATVRHDQNTLDSHHVPSFSVAFPQVCCCAIQDAFEDTLVLPPIIVGTINGWIWREIYREPLFLPHFFSANLRLHLG